MAASRATRRATKRLERETGVADLAALLTERLSPSELTSLLLDVYRRQAAARTPAEVLAAYERDRFSRPSRASPQRLAEFEQMALESLPAEFEAVTLSPVCPLGTSSVVAGVAQDWSVTTSRTSEVVSDATGVLALELASRRRALLRQDTRSRHALHLAAHHRLLRPQFFQGPHQVPHFALLALVSGGRAEGGRSFELRLVELHLRAHLAVVRAYLGPGVKLRVVWSDFSNRDRSEAVEDLVLAPLRQQFESVALEADPAREGGRGYYSGLAFQVYGQGLGEEFFLVDGGEVAWPQRLLSNAKERMVISGLGSERLCTVFGRP